MSANTSAGNVNGMMGLIGNPGQFQNVTPPSPQPYTANGYQQMTTPPQLAPVQVPTAQQAMGESTWNKLNTPTQTQQLGQLPQAQQLGQLSWNNPFITQLNQQIMSQTQQQVDQSLQALQRTFAPQAEAERERVSQRGLVGSGVENEMMRKLYSEQGLTASDLIAKLNLEGNQRMTEMGLQGLGMVSERDIANQQADVQSLQMRSERDIANQQAALEAAGMDKESARALAEMSVNLATTGVESQNAAQQRALDTWKAQNDYRIQVEDIKVAQQQADTEEEKNALQLYKYNLDETWSMFQNGYISQGEYSRRMNELISWYDTETSGGGGYEGGGEGGGAVSPGGPSGTSGGSGGTYNPYAPSTPSENQARVDKILDPKRIVRAPATGYNQSDIDFMQGQGYLFVPKHGSTGGALLGSLNIPQQGQFVKLPSNRSSQGVNFYK